MSTMSRSLVKAALDVIELRSGKRVALYVDETMVRQRGFLPIMAAENEPGYYPFPSDYADVISEVFGGDFREAKARVEEINAERGIGKVDAYMIVASSHAAQRDEDKAVR